MSLLWIAATVLINVMALAGLLHEFGLYEADWSGPFSKLASIYMFAQSNLYEPIAGQMEGLMGFSFPKWAYHVALIYAASASAIMAGGMGVTHRESFLGGLGSTLVSWSWPLALPAFLMQAVRLRIVSKFVRDHTLVVLGYAALVAVLFVGARLTNAYFVA